jgi:uncharacterized protein (TIGR03083 family)
MTSYQLTPSEHVDFVQREAAAVDAVLRAGDLTAPVPSCPDWTLRALAEHLGRVHRWAASRVTGVKTRSELPGADDAVADWYTESADVLLVALRDADPEQPCQAFEESATVSFWQRRQALELAIHRWDAQSSQGRCDPIDTALAADGIEEITGMFYPRQIQLERIPPLTTVLGIEITDVDGPHLTIGDGPAAATLSGPAEAVLLALWRRIPIDDPRLTIRGSRGAAELVVNAGIVP